MWRQGSRPNVRRRSVCHDARRPGVEIPSRARYSGNGGINGASNIKIYGAAAAHGMSMSACANAPYQPSGWKYALAAADRAPRCGARRKATGQPCRAPAMPNGRCHKHGGASTGARTMPPYMTTGPASGFRPIWSSRNMRCSGYVKDTPWVHCFN
jgi:hypothetical protein